MGRHLSPPATARVIGRPSSAVRAHAALTALVALLAVPAAARADEAQAAAPAPPRPLGRLEQESVDEAMAARALRVDPHPAGKVIGAIQVVNQEVFSQRDWLFQLFNIFHRTTRPDILARELLMKPGDRYDEAIVDETIRNLQVSTATVGATTFVPPELSSVVAIIPVVSATPGTVDLLVVTRDVWSLRLNTNFEFQQSTLTLLQTSLSENNLFGWRKYLSVGFDMDQGSMAIGPTYFDPNVLGTRLTFLASTRLTYARGTDAYEGNVETFSLRYPLYSLASKWGGGVDVSHANVVVRHFQGTDLRLEDVTATPVVEAIPYQYRRQVTTVDASAVRSFDLAVIQRVTLGYLFDARRSSVLPDFPYDAATAELYLSQYAPLSERRAEPYLRYDMFTARYAVYRGLDTFDLRENRRLGPLLTLRIGYDLPALGADFRAFAPSGAAVWAEGFGGSFEQLSLQVQARLRDGIWIDQLFKGSVYVATPILGRAARVILSATAEAVRNDTANTLFFVGGDTGLRGYAIGAFQGTRMAIGHLELRSTALPVYSQRFGTVLFYDVGDANISFAALVPYHDLGVGLRWLIPQLNSTVLRFDWAFATQDAPLTRAGWPGRFSAGFAQIF